MKKQNEATALVVLHPFGCKGLYAKEGTEGKVPENINPSTQAPFKFGTADARVQQA